MIHISVLQKEVIKYLSPQPNENFVDATIGRAGHTLAILEENSPRGKVLGIELDQELYQKLEKARIDRLILVSDSYLNLKQIIENFNFRGIKGILFDLGMSSWHLEESGRGFSFQRDEPLDMRYSIESSLRAEDIVNRWREEEIEKILREYGEEMFSRGISREIIKTREKNPIKTTFQLVEIIKKATPFWYQRKRVHFATKTFQALRIALNNELENLKKVLPQAQEVLEKGGRIVVISFHSLEDRIVKNFFREKAKENYLEILTKKPIFPSIEEIRENPRSRSSKLRAALKL